MGALLQDSKRQSWDNGLFFLSEIGGWWWRGVCGGDGTADLFMAQVLRRKQVQWKQMKREDSGTREGAQWVKYLSHEDEDLRSNPQSQYKTRFCHPFISSSITPSDKWEVWTRETLKSLAFYAAAEKINKGPWSLRHGADPRLSSDLHTLHSTCTRAHASTCMHMHVHALMHAHTLVRTHTQEREEDGMREDSRWLFFFLSVSHTSLPTDIPFCLQVSITFFQERNFTPASGFF